MYTGKTLLFAGGANGSAQLLWSETEQDTLRIGKRVG